MKGIPKEFLPPEEYLAQRIFTIPEFQYPEKLNIVRRLYDNVKSWDKTAIYYKDQKITFRELQRETNRLANALKGLGVKENDRVLVKLPNCPEFLYAYYGCWTIGAMVVVAPDLLKKEEIVYRANDSEAKVFLASSNTWPELEECVGEFKSIQMIIVVGERKDGYSFYDDVVSGEPAECEIADTDKYHPALLLYSSGTTGKPKGILQDMAFLYVSGDTTRMIAGSLDEDDILGGAPPFTFPLGSSLPLAQARSGCAMSIVDRPKAEEMFETIEKHRITVLSNVPTMYRMMLQVPDAERRYDLSSVKCCMSAGEWLPGNVRREWIERFGIDIIDALGCGEMTWLFAQPRWSPDDKSDSTGKLLPGFRMRIVNGDFQDVPPGTYGEVLVQGPTGTMYWRRPEQQQKAVHAGWNRVGLVGKLDADGYLWLRGRVDNMIITSGYKVAGGEVESTLMRHRAVLEAAVIASPDEVRGNVVKAFVVLRKGFEPSDDMIKELQEYVKVNLEPYKYPRKIQFMKSEMLPRTLSGKINYHELAEMEKHTREYVSFEDPVATLKPHPG
jgi:2-aminobenzoate-CoA ligase